MPQRTQLVAPPISIRNHYRYAMHSMGSPEVHHLCFIPIRQYLLMLIGHMSEDDEITLDALSTRASVRKGLNYEKCRENQWSQ